MKLFLRMLVAVLLVSRLSAIPAFAGTGTIEGVVLDQQGSPAPGAAVTLVELRRHATADENGRFRFEDVPPGHYHVQVESTRSGGAVAEIDLADGATSAVTVAIDRTVHAEHVVVSASLDARSAAEVVQPVDVLEGTELQTRIQGTLGETLAQEPGMRSTYYAPGASRPVIRGLGGDRIRILEDGIGTADASNVSPDHAVSLDPLGTDRVEIVRGPATLMYGSNAVGGVVNVLDGRIPDHVPAAAVGGSFGLRFASAAEERAGSLNLTGGARRVAWQAGYLDRRADDLETPDGPIENSDLDAASGTAGVSYVGGRGFVGLSFTDYESNYGAAVEEQVRIDLQQKRYDLRGEYNTPFAIFRALRLRFGVGDYEHTELEGQEVGTLFLNDSWEGRLELPHRRLGAFEGAIGVQLVDRDFEAIGEEAFVQPTTTGNQALFVFEEIGEGKVRGEIGLRYDRQQTRSVDPTLQDRDFDAVSGSGGIVWNPAETYAVALSLARSTRLPTAEELYSNGPHLATFAFEVGDDDLGEETSEGIDLALRKLTGRLRGELNLFRNEFNDFINDEFTGAFDPGEDPIDPEDDLPIFRFVQADATFSGFEAVVHVELFHAEPHHVELELRGDRVEAELADGRNLPRIPPMRYGASLRYQGSKLWGNLEVTRTDEQDEIATDINGDPLETPTAGYTWLNAAVGYRLIAGHTVHDIVLRGINLTDEFSRNHVSRFKDLVPLTGADVSLMYRLVF